MTQETPSGGPSGSSKLSLVAHSLVYVLGAATLARVASWFGWLEGVNEVLTWMLVVTVGASIWHRLRSGLCLRCLAEVPADAPVRAERQRGLLKIAHFNSSWKSVAITVAFVVLSPVVLALLLGGDHSKISSAPADILVFVLIYAEWLHHRLRPWCPYCRDWDDDGDPEPSPDPTTFGTKTAH